MKMISCIVVLSLALALSFASSPDALTDTEKTAFVSAHNDVRAAVGVKTLLVWNNTLSSFAETHASKCEFKHSSSKYGENIFASWPANYDHKSVALDSLKSWASEKKLVDFNDWKCIATGACGHYSQVIWNNTKAVGCAIAHCPKVSNLVVCEYWPSGNLLPQKPY
ncbi:unnamed protein product [Lymnaea stagnalis]|uniref:SCP domain-containing protein n=1 Tax=Lymnaea stagnalis TaxID=6523 RepID=A0AAV2IKL6_LYMST